MKLSVKSLGIKDDLGKFELKLTAREANGDFVGNLYISKSDLVWCEGQTIRDCGKKVSFEALRGYMNAL